MLVTNEDMDVKKSQDETSNDADFHRFDEQVRSMIAIEPYFKTSMGYQFYIIHRDLLGMT